MILRGAMVYDPSTNIFATTSFVAMSRGKLGARTPIHATKFAVTFIRLNR